MRCKERDGADSGEATVPSVLGFRLVAMGMLHYGDAGSVEGVKRTRDSRADEY